MKYAVFLILFIGSCYSYYTKEVTRKISYERGIHDTIRYTIRVKIVNKDTISIDTIKTKHNDN